MRAVLRGACGLAVVLATGLAGAQSAPPPRSTADILAALEEHKPDPDKVNRLRAVLAAPPPQGADPRDLRNYHLARGEAASELGLVNQALVDLRKALELTPPGDSQRWTVYLQIAVTEWHAGDYAASMRMWEAGPGAATLAGAQLSAWAAVAWARSSLGDLAGARKALDQAESILPQLQQMRFWSALGANWSAQMHRARAQVLRLEGKHAQSEAELRAALASIEKHIELAPELASNPEFSNLPPVAHSHRLALSWEWNQLAFTLLEQGRFAEAELSARNGLKRSLRVFGRYAPETGAVLIRLARLVREQGRIEEAASLARAAIDIYQRIGAVPHSQIFVNARRNLAASLVDAGRFAEADALFAAVAADLRPQPEAAEALGPGTLAGVYALVRLGRAEPALELARAIYRRESSRFGDALYQVHEARGHYALALAAAGRDEEALREFRAAVPRLLAAAGERSGEEGLGYGRTRRLTRVLEAYLGLLARRAALPASPGLDPVAESFRIADVARGSSVQRALTAASARAAIRDPELAKLAREEQDIAQRVGSLTGILVDLLARPANKQLPAVIAAMREDITHLRRRRLELKQDIEKRFPDYANLIDPKPVALDAARRLIGPDEALLVLYGTEDRTLAWAITQGGVRFHAAALGRGERDALVAELRKALDVGPVPLERFPAFDVAAAHKLYSALLAPLEPVWGSAKSLLVVPHGSLGLLPFSVLVTRPETVASGGLAFEGYKNVAWLAQRAAITQLSSVSTLASLRSVKRASAPAKRFAGFGDPVFGGEQVAAATTTRGFRLRSAAFTDPAARKALSAQLAQLASLPDTAEELEGIAKALGAAASQDVLLREKATETAVKQADLSDRRVIAFATHGLVPGELDGLTQPALALSNPKITGEKDADGLLSMEEILGLKLNADWVVLSACNTASAGGAGEEAVSGLGKAFFYAGARALLVSNWPVETVSAKLLTTDIFRRQAADPKLPRAEALRQSMLHLMGQTAQDRDGKPWFSYAHPMFWAPFSLVGDGGGG